MESAFNDTLIANVTTGTASAVSRYVYYKDSAGVRIDSTGEMAGYQAQNLSFVQHYDADGVSYLGNAKAVLWPDKTDFAATNTFSTFTPSVSASANGLLCATNGGGSVAVTADGAAWVEGRPVSGDANLDWLYALASNGSLFVGAGDTGKIATSPDGINWTARTISTTPGYWAAAGCGNGLFILGGNNGEIATSPDGATWTNRTSPNTDRIFNIVYMGGEYFTLGGSGEVAVSTDGITWTAATSTFGTSVVAAGIYANGLYVIVGDDGKLATSPNGTTWTARTANMGTTPIYDITYGNGLFVVSGDAGVATSPDGITWTARSSAVISQTTYGQRGVVYRAGYFFVAGDVGKIAYSTNGTAWATTTVWTGTNKIDAIGINGGTLIAIGANGKLAVNETGSTWAEKTAPQGSSAVTVTGYGLGKYLLADSLGNIGVSSDGSTWVSGGAPLGGTDAIYGFAANSSLIVAVGNSGKVYTSPDGVTWTARSSTFSTSAVRGVVWSGTQFVIVGDGGKLATSPDGITWTSRTSSFSTTDIRSVTFGASTYVAVGYAGKAATSSDGITWTQRTSSFGTTNILSVIYGEKFVATGSGTTVATSTDGITWTQRTTTVTPSNVAYGYSTYLMVGSNGSGSGLYATSSDGITWTNSTSMALRDVMQYAAFGGGLFVVGANNGRVTVSGDGNFVASHTINGAVLAATDGGSGVVVASQPSAGIAYSSSSNAPRTLPNGVQIRFNSTGNIVGPVLSDRIVRSLAAGTVSNDLTMVGALSCGLLTSYTSPSVYTEVSTVAHPDYSRKVNNLAAGTGHKLTLAQAMNFSFPLVETTANITHLAVFKTSGGELAWVVPLPTAIPSGSSVASFNVVAGAFTLDFADASTVAP